MSEDSVAFELVPVTRTVASTGCLVSSSATPETETVSPMRAYALGSSVSQVTVAVSVPPAFVCSVAVAGSTGETPGAVVAEMASTLVTAMPGASAT